MEYHALKPEEQVHSELSDEFSNEDEEEEGDVDDGQNEDESTNVFMEELKIPPYEHAKRQLSQLLDLMSGPYLDLSPDYQRGVVWTQKAMRLLIDSMWKGYYIPPVIFNIETVEDEIGVLRFKRTCVDGKQRLTAIREFMTGQFPCRINNKSWYFCNPSNRPMLSDRRNILPESAKEEFKRIELLCTEYRGLSQTQELEIFQRVQLGVRLSQAEVFRATRGVWQDLAKIYEKDFSNVIDLVKHKRASGFKLILMCFMQIYECFEPSGADDQPKILKASRLIRAFCANDASLDANKKRHLRFVFTLFQDLVVENIRTFENNRYSTSLQFAPLELVAVCCLISQKGAERPKGILRGDILALRSRLREDYTVLRLNNICWSTAWEFIDTLEHHRGFIHRSIIPAKSPKSAKLIKRKSHVQPRAAAAPAPNRNPHSISDHGQRHNRKTTAKTPQSNPSFRATAKNQYPVTKTPIFNRQPVRNNSSLPAKPLAIHPASALSNRSIPTNKLVPYHSSESNKQSTLIETATINHSSAPNDNIHISSPHPSSTTDSLSNHSPPSFTLNPNPLPPKRNFKPPTPISRTLIAQISRSPSSTSSSEDTPPPFPSRKRSAPDFLPTGSSEPSPKKANLLPETIKIETNDNGD